MRFPFQLPNNAAQILANRPSPSAPSAHIPVRASAPTTPEMPNSSRHLLRGSATASKNKSDNGSPIHANRYPQAAQSAPKPVTTSVPNFSRPFGQESATAPESKPVNGSPAAHSAQSRGLEPGAAAHRWGDLSAKFLQTGAFQEAKAMAQRLRVIKRPQPQLTGSPASNKYNGLKGGQKGVTTIRAGSANGLQTKSPLSDTCRQSNAVECIASMQESFAANNPETARRTMEGADLEKRRPETERNVGKSTDGKSAFIATGVLAGSSVGTPSIGTIRAVRKRNLKGDHGGGSKSVPDPLGRVTPKEPEVLWAKAEKLTRVKATPVQVKSGRNAL